MANAWWSGDAAELLASEPETIVQAKTLATIPAWQDIPIDFARRNYKVIVAVLLALLLGLVGGAMLANFMRK